MRPLYREAMAGAGGASPAPGRTESHTHQEHQRKESAMTSISPDDQERAAIIKGYRDLLDWLEAHPEVPLNGVCNSITYSALGDDESNRAEIDRAAKVLGVEASGTTHYQVRRSFGPVEYRAVAVMSGYLAKHRALQSYRGSVQPEQDEVAEGGGQS